jgi:hypothetical protein
MRVEPCHAPHHVRPLLRRHAVVRECHASPRYDDHLKRENALQSGTVGPSAYSPIPFDLRLASLNAQLRRANRSADALRVDIYA